MSCCCWANYILKLIFTILQKKKKRNWSLPAFDSAFTPYVHLIKELCLSNFKITCIHFVKEFIRNATQILIGWQVSSNWGFFPVNFLWHAKMNFNVLKYKSYTNSNLCAGFRFLHIKSGAFWWSLVINSSSICIKKQWEKDL